MIPVFDYKIIDIKKVSKFVKNGWVKCSREEIKQNTYMRLDETFDVAGVTMVKKESE